jgi:hypothetical protein
MTLGGAKHPAPPGATTPRISTSLALSGHASGARRLGPIELTGTNETFAVPPIPLIIEADMATDLRLRLHAANFYVWRAPGKSFSIHLGFNVIEKLQKEQSRATSEHPARSISGVLLGRSIEGTSFVEDFVLLPRDPAPGDEAEFSTEERLADLVRNLLGDAERGRHTIGYFRWQRDGRLCMNTSDLKTANRVFSEPDNVVLLIRSSQNTGTEAMFFHWEDGEMQTNSGAKFPFDPAKLSAGLQNAKSESPLNGKAKQAASQELKTPFAQPIPWMRLLPTVALCILGVAFVALALDAGWVGSRKPSAPEIGGVYDSPLGLRVSSRSKQLEVRWIHDSSTIRSADRGLMKIFDGEITEDVHFDQRQLKDGYVAYVPSTNDVTIRLEVHGSDGSTIAESVRSIATP